MNPSPVVFFVRLFVKKKTQEACFETQGHRPDLAILLFSSPCVLPKPRPQTAAEPAGSRRSRRPGAHTTSPRLSAVVTAPRAEGDRSLP